MHMKNSHNNVAIFCMKDLIYFKILAYDHHAINTKKSI